MRNKVILIDVDNVVADLITPWLNWYNNTYVDDLKPQDITDWDIAKFVKPECGQRIYDFVSSPGVYYTVVKPVKHSRKVIKALQEKGNRVVFITAINDYVKDGVKLNWLNCNGFDVSPINYYEMNDKSNADGDLFIDDGWHNISSSSIKNSYLYTRPWNIKYEYDKRVSNWKEIAKLCDVKIGLR